MPRDLPTLNLEQVDDLVTVEDSINKFFHAYGIFKKEIQVRTAVHWQLYDEHKEIEIRLSGATTEYPRPKPGDIIRIHRLRVNTQYKLAEIPLARNVLIWPAFQHDPKPISTARNPTLTDHDQLRRRILEAYFCTRVSNLLDISNNRQVDVFYEAVMGRFENITTDLYGHHEIEFTDGTARMIIRVFRKSKDWEDDMHFRVASELVKGQYFVATNVKLGAGRRLNLSANSNHGRSLRLVEQSSILGTKLTNALEKTDRPQASSTSNGTSLGGVASSQPRRSPRLLQMNQDENRPQVQSSSPSATQIEVEEYVPVVETPPPPPEVYPNFTPYAEIQRRDLGYDFYDLIGQVRTKPRMTSDFGNCILQIFDGSLHEFANFYAHEVDEPLDGCLILCIYSKQKETDTNEHFDKAMALDEGDIIYVTNVKVSFIMGRIRCELSANKSHNKSFNVIDKESSFGRKILNMAECPQVAELRDIIDPGSDFYDSDDNHRF